MIYLILSLVFILRLISINQSLWLDEAISALAAKNYNFAELITKFSIGDTHPPLYYLVLRIWGIFFGFSETSLRIPSVILGILTVFVVYKIGETIGGKKLGSVASLLMATAPLHIYYSQEARMYSMTTFFVALFIYSFLKKNFKGLSISALLLGLTDYPPLLILPVIWIYSIYKKKDKKFFLSLVASLMPLFIFSLIWLPIFLKQITSTISFVNSHLWWKSALGMSSLKQLSLIWVKFIIGRINFDNRFIYAFVVFIASFFIAIPFYKAFRRGREILIIWLWFIIPLVIFFLLSFMVAGFSYFRLLFLLPAFYLIISFGISKIPKANLLTLAIVVMNLIFSLIYLTRPSFWREDWRGLVSFIEERIKEGEVIVVSYPEAFAGYRWYSKKPDKVKSFDEFKEENFNSVYTLDYLMDLTDPKRENYDLLRNQGFKEEEVFNFRGVGQVRYWKKI